MSDDQEPQRPWPRRGQKLRGTADASDESWFLNACFFTDRDLNLYADGYRAAAQTLLDSVSEKNRKVDVMIFPFVFCWRQCLELRLKMIISCGRILNGQDAGFPVTHDIKRLLGEARTVLESVETTTPEYDAVRDIVHEFADMDPDSFSFRYPMKKDQTATVPSGTPNLNWTQFHVTMSAVANFLEAAQCELDVRMDYVIDRNAEASRNEYS